MDEEEIVMTLDDDESILLSADSNDDINFNSNTYINQTIFTSDSYSDLQNKPSINDILLEGNRTSADFDFATVYFNKTSDWNAARNVIAQYHAVYVYTDYKSINGHDVAGFKIGDGTTYLIDLPFVDAFASMHEVDSEAHITNAEREFWNNKNRAIVDGETLVLTKE